MVPSSCTLIFYSRLAFSVGQPLRRWLPDRCCSIVYRHAPPPHDLVYFEFPECRVGQRGGSLLSLKLHLLCAP
ncbi:hypothetical protein Mp_2g15340 [Marchantia polymorpha subsp. ruderalis]|uniref:Uncharacterized protein n=1 Tax=Marchantia polymorpha TaxID=3197 RepID=A0A2R6WJZ8_MARPO|nr:hypothetical protein MARPO_0082s0031 [Marchantia polymorpha]BBN02432.1 hypothetical protein Mp_2g15340 [Marchantia polymorpha subsp. ruderalis]|eukprot:PTQ34180.1 hypothetical protein MARPO_0082s0031 [Marchantia polymorpha]